MDRLGIDHISSQNPTSAMACICNSNLPFQHEGDGGAWITVRRKDGPTMPRYEFVCEKSNKAFELISTVSERKGT